MSLRDHVPVGWCIPSQNVILLGIARLCVLGQLSTSDNVPKAKEVRKEKAKEGHSLLYS